VNHEAFLACGAREPLVERDERQGGWTAFGAHVRRGQLQGVVRAERVYSEKPSGGLEHLAANVLDRNTFADDFVKFIREAKLEDRAFEETIVAIRTEETGDVARSTVHYAARIPSLERPAQHGVDVFLLMKTVNGWRIVSIVNETVRPGVQVPEEIRKAPPPAGRPGAERGVAG
jgi:hypothetical protein